MTTIDALPTITHAATIRDAMLAIERSGCGIALVVDGDGVLLGTVSDGDVRRAVLAGLNLDESISALAAAGLKHHPIPMAAPAGTDSATLLAMMRSRGVKQVPLLDVAGRVVDLVTMDDLLPREPLDCEAAILAGGYGTRLAPLTDDTPKPMLPVNGRPLLEITLERLRDAGIRRVGIITHHLAERVMEHFGDGATMGLEVHYIHETEPLGTAGALGALDGDGPVLVLNGDLVTNVDYRAMLAYHREQGADLTIAVRRIVWPVPYGVVEVDGPRVTELIEKPEATVLINAGIYILEPYVRQHIPTKPAHMTHIIGTLLAMSRPVVAFPVTDSEGWLDVGSPAEYERAQREVA